MKSTEKAWLAGIIDGEGCIHIRKNSPTERSKHRSVMYSLVLKVSMCHRETIDRIHAIVGLGHVSRSASAKPNHQEAWAWYTQSREAGFVLQAVLPYLVTKGVEANTALQFLNLPSARSGRRLVSPELTAHREHFYKLLQALKPRKGNREGGFDPISLDTPNLRVAVDSKHLAHIGQGQRETAQSSLPPQI
jgi:hypothetical protein